MYYVQYPVLKIFSIRSHALNAAFGMSMNIKLSA